MKERYKSSSSQRVAASKTPTSTIHCRVKKTMLTSSCHCILFIMNGF